jgi:hypothetical protein
LTHPGSYNGAAMRRNSLRADWFFPIEEAPVFATVNESMEETLQKSRKEKK